jgi:hypothetical protein
MNRSSTAVRCIIAALISVTSAAFGQAFAAAVTNGECPNGRATIAAVTDSVQPSSDGPTASNSSPLTLFIEPPTGSTFRLIYLPTEGWMFADRAVNQKPIEAALTPIAMPPSDENSGVEEPLTVFIDGPTGFTYVWMRDAGWEFIGRIANRKR